MLNSASNGITISALQDKPEIEKHSFSCDIAIDYHGLVQSIFLLDINSENSEKMTGASSTKFSPRS